MNIEVEKLFPKVPKLLSQFDREKKRASSISVGKNIVAAI